MQSKKNLDPQTINLFLALIAMTAFLVYFMKVVALSTPEDPQLRAQPPAVERATK